MKMTLTIPERKPDARITTGLLDGLIGDARKWIDANQQPGQFGTSYQSDDAIKITIIARHFPGGWPAFVAPFLVAETRAQMERRYGKRFTDAAFS